MRWCLWHEFTVRPCGFCRRMSFDIHVNQSQTPHDTSKLRSLSPSVAYTTTAQAPTAPPLTGQAHGDVTSTSLSIGSCAFRHRHRGHCALPGGVLLTWRHCQRFGCGTESFLQFLENKMKRRWRWNVGYIMDEWIVDAFPAAELLPSKRVVF